MGVSHLYDGRDCRSVRLFDFRADPVPCGSAFGMDDSSDGVAIPLLPMGDCIVPGQDGKMGLMGQNREEGGG